MYDMKGVLYMSAASMVFETLTGGKGMVAVRADKGTCAFYDILEFSFTQNNNSQLQTLAPVNLGYV
jgi:hypothetical protein